MIRSTLCIVLIGEILWTGQGFQLQLPQRRMLPTATPPPPPRPLRHFEPSSNKRKPLTRVSLFLPPSNDRNRFGSIISSIASVVLITAFFLSPLGGFVLSIFNSLLILSFLIPIMAGLGFQIWQFFNTISGPCPNCGTPLRVFKRDGGALATTSICMNCGSFVQASRDNSGIDLLVVEKDPFVDSTSSIFESFFAPTGTRRMTSKEQTIIDVVYDDDDE